MLFQKERFIKKKRCHIPHSNSDWLLCPSGSSFESLIAAEENAFISSWILWAPIFLNSAHSLAKTKDLFYCWPTDESSWVSDGLGSTWAAGGEGRIKPMDPLCTWHSTYCRWDLCSCLVRTKTTQTDVFLSQGLLQYSR